MPLFNDADLPILSGPVKRSGEMTEICRSFSYKLNLQNHGGPQYESIDFFASRKLAVPVEDATLRSEAIYQECVTEVRAAVDAVKATLRRKYDRESKAVDDVARRIA